MMTSGRTPKLWGPGPQNLNPALLPADRPCTWARRTTHAPAILSTSASGWASFPCQCVTF